MEGKDWLIVESFANWKTDEKNNFSYFGITEKFVRLKGEIRAGDHLFAYVTGKSSFSDIRMVVQDGLGELAMGGDYEKSLPYCIVTKPVLILPPDRWISIRDIKDQLSITAGRKYPASIFQSAPRRIEKSDAEVLERLLASKRVQ